MESPALVWIIVMSAYQGAAIYRSRSSIVVNSIDDAKSSGKVKPVFQLTGILTLDAGVAFVTHPCAVTRKNIALAINNGLKYIIFLSPMVWLERLYLLLIFQVDL